MATKYTDLPAAAALDGSEILAVVQGGDSVQTTTQDIANLGGGGGGVVQTIVAGTNVTVDDTDPQNPIVSASGGGTTEHVDKTTSFTVAKADTQKTYVMDSGSPIVATLPDLSAETVDYEWGFYVKGAGGGSFDPDGETSFNTAGNDNFSDQNSFMYLYYDHVANAYYIQNGTAGVGAQDLQSVLDEGSTVTGAGDIIIDAGAGADFLIGLTTPFDNINLGGQSTNIVADVGINFELGAAGAFSINTAQPVSLNGDTGAEGEVLTAHGALLPPTWETPTGGPKVIQTACSDETTPLTTGTKVTFRMPYAMTLTAVRASLTTAQDSGSILTVDIEENGTTILSTLITIDNTEKTSTTAVAAPVISDSALTDDAEITIIITQIGDGTAVGLKVSLIGT